MLIAISKSDMLDDELKAAISRKCLKYPSSVYFFSGYQFRTYGVEDAVEGA